MAKGRHGAPDLDIRLPRLCTEKGLELGKHRNQGAHPSPISLPAQVMLSWASALGQLYPQTIFPFCQQLKATHDFFFFFNTDFLTSYVNSPPPGSRHQDGTRSARNLLRGMTVKEEREEGAEVGRERLRVILPPRKSRPAPPEL